MWPLLPGKVYRRVYSHNKAVTARPRTMNSTLLCRDPHSEDHGLVAVVWAGAGLAATLTMLLLLLTAAGARRVARRLHEAGTSCCSGDEDGEEAELDYSMYEAIPEEYLDKRRQSELEVILEDDECFYDGDTDTASCPDPSPPPSSGCSSLSTTPAPSHTSLPLPLPPRRRSHEVAGARSRFSRSNSTPGAQEAAPGPHRNSLLGPGHGKKGAGVRRTESQNRADYLLKVRLQARLARLGTAVCLQVMTQGGSVASYQPPAPAKISPTGRKISVDRVPGAAPRPLARPHPPHYENLPSITIRVTEEGEGEDSVTDRNCCIEAATE